MEYLAGSTNLSGAIRLARTHLLNPSMREVTGFRNFEVPVIIILLTDGVNNSGFIDPQTASELAVEYGIKTYTIGLGSNGMALSPVAINNGVFQYSRIQVEIDEELLKEIADATGGKYFRATNNKKLEEIYDEIDKLEKTEIEEFKYYNYEEKFRPLVLLALALLTLEFLLRHTLLRSFI